VDGGVIIHESRFVYQKRGHQLLHDLGALWEKRHQLPLPLGALVVHEEVESKEIIETLRRSMAYSRDRMEEAFSYIQQCSQEKDREIIEQHIALYVNEETYALSSLGRRAITTLFEQANSKGLLHEQAALRFCH
jgi:1,4-dihydroxy-6-naphthoate synthase